MTLPGLGPCRDAEVNRRVKAWVTEAFDVESDATVMVAELACSEPDCPPVETMIAILRSGDQRRYTIHRPMCDVTRADIEALVTA